MRAVICAAVLVMAGAALGAQAAKAEPVYDVTFVTGPAGQEQAYTGTSTFNVDAKGVVTGKMLISAPTTVRATIGGQIEKGTWTFKYSYEMPDQGCTGSLEGSAAVPTDRKSISGKVLIGGDCAPEPMNGTFTFKLQEKK
jgi:hypothetical protein